MKTKLFLFFLLQVVGETVQAQTSYREASWDGSKVTYVSKTAVAAPVTRTSNRLMPGWYVVDSNITISLRCVVNGEVNLIICDGKTLTLEQGLVLDEGDVLNVFAQTAGTGAIVTTGSGTAPGIGLASGSKTGTLTIHGGNITSKGAYSSAGIAVNAVTVYGGKVNSEGGELGAGIGTSLGGSTVIIYGGVITAKGGQYGAGIGGSMGTAGGDVTICGGSVTAYGGADINGAGEGIGRGYGYGSKGNLTTADDIVVFGDRSTDLMNVLTSPYGTRYQYMRAESKSPSSGLDKGALLTALCDAIAYYDSIFADPSASEIAAELKAAIVAAHAVCADEEVTQPQLNSAAQTLVAALAKAIHDNGDDEEETSIRAKDCSREYGELNPVFEYTVSGGTLQGTPELACSATKLSDVGIYAITVSKGTVTNKKVTFEDGILTVTKAPLTVSVKNCIRKQGEQNPIFELEYLGLRNSDSPEEALQKLPTISCSATSSSDPGEYAVTLNGGQSKNYDLTLVNGTLTVVMADELVLTADDKERFYGDDNPELTFTQTGETLKGEPVLNCEANNKSPVGIYDIVIAKGTTENYNVRYVNGNLTVKKAPLTITVKDCVKKRGEENPDFELEYDGLKNGETPEEALEVLPTVTCMAAPESEPGNYVITLSGAQSENYELALVNGILTVEESSGVYALSVDGSKLFDVYTPAGVLFRHRATSLQGLPRGVYLVEGRKVVVK